MRKEIADLVYPVFTYALRVKEQLARGESLSLSREQAALKGLLKSDSEARRWSDYSGEQSVSTSIAGRGSSSAFLGIRYALVCWLDEIFILDSPWRKEWNENKLETALYGTNIRNENFWEQVKRAEARSGSDALEVFFLCVMLGFRGEMRQNPEGLRAWREAAESQISQNQAREWAGPPDAQLSFDAPPLHGAQRFRSMALTFGVAVLLLIPAAMFYLVLQFRR
jgi:type VI secretion system protein ImpK